MVVSVPEPPGRSKESAPAAAWGPRACCGAVHPTEQGKVRRVGPRCLPARSPRRGHPSASPPPRRPTAPPAVSCLMQRDLHPRHPPWPHGWHVAPGPRQGRRGLGARRQLRRRAGHASEQVHELRAVYGREPGQPARSGPWHCGVGASTGTADRVGEVTHHTTEASSVSWAPSMGPNTGVPAPWRAGRLRASGVTTHHAHQRRVMEPADRTGQSECGDWHCRVCASSWRRSEATTRH